MPAEGKLSHKHAASQLSDFSPARDLILERRLCSEQTDGQTEDRQTDSTNV